ncbi:MAG: SLC13 family permease [Candidatus Paceibacterota bacterium]
MMDIYTTVMDFLTALPADQIIVFAVLVGALVMFMWGKLRYDMVAILALLIVVIAGVMPVESAFYGFSHPAVIIVVSMFVLSQALVNSGVIEIVTRRFSGLAGRPVLQLLTLTVFVSIASAFLANVGALAFSIPIAVKMAKESNVSPAMFLMPVAFASHLGAFLTLIGSPRNIIVSEFREQATGTAFSLFDFATVGAGIIVVGVLFLALLAWRLIPNRHGESEKSELFEVENYITEVKVGEESSSIGKSLKELAGIVDTRVVFVALIRDYQKISYPSSGHQLQAGDVLLIQDDAESLTELVEAAGLDLVGEHAEEGAADPDDEVIDAEVVVTRKSRLVDSTWKQMPLNLRYGVNLLAVSRSGGQLNKHLDDVHFKVGDVMLLRGREESVNYTVDAFKGLPLENRDLKLGRSTAIFKTLAIFILAIVVASFGILDIHIAFLAAAVAVVLLDMTGIKEAYESVDWSIVVLLGAIITFGQALVISGGAGQIADGILGLADYLSPALMVLAVMLVTTLMSDFVNANVAAVVMAPVGILIAETIGVSIDPLLMAVAVGANMAFLTPTAHESNALVMGSGGYKYRDFWKVGLPLEILIIAISMPLILYFWPLNPEPTEYEYDTVTEVRYELNKSERIFALEQ